MFGKRFGDDQDAAARSKRDRCLRPGVRTGGQAAIEFTQPCDCDRAVCLREGRERGVELCGLSKARRDVAKVDNLGADRQRRQQWCALQRLGLVWHRRKPAVAPSVSAAMTAAV
jgi:hypothetical protein